MLCNSIYRAVFKIRVLHMTRKSVLTLYDVSCRVCDKCDNFVLLYSLSRLILANLMGAPDTSLEKKVFGLTLLSTHSVLKKSFSFLQKK